MDKLQQYIATLRCRTWHSWPEKTHIATKACRIKLSGGVNVIAGVAVASYIARSAPDNYTPERAELGPLLWKGEIPGLYVVQGQILKAPDDVISITLEHEPPQKGEIDILVAFNGPGDLPSSAADALRGIALALLSLFNLRLGDHLMPCAPLQIGRVVAKNRQFENEVSFAVTNRDSLSVTMIEDVLREFFDAVLRGAESNRLQTALELYGSHFSEASAKTRFLLLVMAMEVLATPTMKHAASLRFLDKWQAELTEERERFAESTPEFIALAALERELLLRREDSIRNQVRHLMLRVSTFDPNNRVDLAKRAVKVYDKRSRLVHDGTLSSADLVVLEKEARDLLETALRFLLSETKPKFTS
ncbi:MAG TPA: hypothetical protein VI306_02505 [Pyrinomonadaceae bacterium]